MKIATVHAALDGAGAIEKGPMEAALAAVAYCWRAGRRYFEFFPLSDMAKVEGRILTMIAEKNPIRRSEVHQRLSGRVGADTLNRIIQGLIASQRIIQTRDGRGRLWLASLDKDLDNAGPQH